MTSLRRLEDGRPGALFWLGIVIAVLFVVRTLAKALEAPMALRLVLGMALITTLGVLAGLLVVRRLRGSVVAARSALGVGGVALFLVGFSLFDGRSPWVTAIGGLMGFAAIGAALVASLWDWTPPKPEIRRTGPFES